MGNKNSTVKKIYPINPLDREIQLMFDNPKIIQSLILQVVPEELTDALWKKYKTEGMEGFLVVNESLMTERKGKKEWYVIQNQERRPERESFEDPAFVMTLKNTCYPPGYYGKLKSEPEITDEEFEEAANNYEDSKKGTRRKRRSKQTRRSKRRSRSKNSRK